MASEHTVSSASTASGPARVIAISNQKGGVGTTTSVINLGAALVEAGRRVLLVDLDPQGHMAIGLGIDPEPLPATMYHVLTGDAKLEDIVAETGIARLAVAPSNLDLAMAEMQLAGAAGREHLLREQLPQLNGRFDTVLIDCPPSLSLLTLNALTAATEVVIPVQAQFYSYIGFASLMETMDLVRRRLNPRVQLAGVVITQFDRRTTIHRKSVEELRAELGSRHRIFQTVIPHGIKAQEATMHQQPVLHFDPKSSVAQAYRQLAGEVISRW